MLDNARTSSEEDTTTTDINQRIADRIRELRAARAYTLDALAARCGVSRSMISMIERGAASPTAVVLDKLAAGLGVSLASLFGGEQEGAPAEPLARRRQQLKWRDPESGYTRRNLSPPGWPSPFQLVEVDFPPCARVAYERSGRESTMHQQVWVMSGCIDIVIGDELHALQQGDCLAIRLDRPLIFNNPASKAARYILAISDTPTT